MAQIHILITRDTGDVERYKVGDAKDLRYAYGWLRKAQKIPIPKRLPRLLSGGRLLALRKVA